MKCIQVVGQGVPVRLSDADAYQIVVRDHDGDYCPKHVWKQWYDRQEKPRLTITLEKQ
jgi:hypothetical protein